MSPKPKRTFHKLTTDEVKYLIEHWNAGNHWPGQYAEKFGVTKMAIKIRVRNLVEDGLINPY